MTSTEQSEQLINHWMSLDDHRYPEQFVTHHQNDLQCVKLDIKRY